jgi:hypothetical protein
MSAVITAAELGTIIRKASEMSSKAESSKFDEQIIANQLKTAENRISSAEGQVTKYDAEKQEIQDKLSPPPTKEIQGQGKKGNGTKKVVDEREKQRLESAMRASDVQLSQAKSAVESARAEADELRNKALDRAGISKEQQQSMQSLLQNLNALKVEAKDDQTDVNGDQFQRKLKETVEMANKLTTDLPSKGAAVLKGFWDDVQKGFKDVQTAITESLTPKPAELKTSNNYAGYFEDIEQGYNTILNHLERSGVDRAVLGEVRNSRDSITNERNTYLGGMTSNDNNVIQSHLTDINVMIAKINKGESLENSDIAKLSQGAQRSSKILEAGGRAFEDVVAIPFNTIAANMNALNSRVDDESFKDFFKLLSNMYNHPNNTYSDLVGITVDQVNQLYDFGDLVTELKDKNDLSSSDINNLVTKGTEVLDMLKARFGFTTADSSVHTGNGGAGATGNSRVGSGSNRRY